MKFVSLVAVTVLASLGSATSVEENDNGFFKLGFEVKRGDGLANIDSDKKGRFVKRASSNNPIEVQLENAETFYIADLNIGSKEDKVQVLVDTGSSDLWVMSGDVKCLASSSSSTKKRNLASDIGAHRGGNVIDIASKPTKTVNKGILNEYSSLLSEIGIEATDVSYESSDPWVDPGLGGFASLVSESSYESGQSGSDGDSDASATVDCTSYGSFSTEGSDTFKKNSSSDLFDISYADGSEAIGVWGTDDVKIGNVTVKGLSLAVVNESSSDVGVLGIGLPGSEVTYSGSSSSSYEYDNLPLRLKALGYLKKVVYSLYLGDSDSKYGDLLFGAVDTSKYSGDLTTFPIVNSYASLGISSPIRLEINLDSVSAAASNSSSKHKVADNGYTALLDSGTTLCYFPESVVTKLGESFNLDYSQNVGAYSIDCNLDSAAQVVFTFSGTSYSVSLSSFILESDGDTCYLGIIGQSADSETGLESYILGDNFLRNFYVVYDLEDLTISLAKAKHDSSDSNIESVLSTIPGASSAKNAKTSALTGGSESPSATAVTTLANGSDSTSEATEDSDSDSGSDGDSGNTKDSFAFRVAPSFFMVFASLTLVAFF
ncbi:aspartyl protease [Yamadazyma tenuis]|uniref:candidapepsin n=1 Tax=Candida tenuis (strain ATCC 10573 / BCRC 21748 / CBS 615 / JCM 9827 / NBRC 10315 / NRRL Y-1498 / VKM Y-70) TaxID=590646 RepID=G3AYB7_CANTC|nr:acid protease [Yamadazyma tenuis ATCC 10573]EGV65814.1 acid protease [Yamadazyma tenuis ATCC 10573]WEJ95856.1 aspartyl protease [Yamadazyma tenuis]